MEETLIQSQEAERPDITNLYNQAISGPQARIDSVDNFFKRHIGESSIGNAANFGLDVEGFMKWEMNSERLGTDTHPGSDYWKKANGQMIHDMLMAEELVKQGKEHLATDAEQK